MLKKMLACFQSNYKARLAKIFIINVSFFIRAIWLVVEAFLDRVVKMKMMVSMSDAPPELVELIDPSQRLKRHGGLCDLPDRAWPPVFPKWEVKDSDNLENHMTEEEFKEELIKNPIILPPEHLSHFAREHCKATRKKGVFPHKTYIMEDRIERRDSFNGISEVVPIKKVDWDLVAQKRAIEMAKREEERKEENRLAAEEQKRKVEKMRLEMEQKKQEEIIKQAAIAAEQKRQEDLLKAANEQKKDEIINEKSGKRTGGEESKIQIEEKGIEVKESEAVKEKVKQEIIKEETTTTKLEAKTIQPEKQVEETIKEKKLIR